MVSRGGGEGGSTTPQTDEHQHRFSRLNIPVPSLFRRLTDRSNANRANDVSDDLQVEDAVPTRRRRPFSSLGRSESRRFSYIHQETVTTISERDTTYSPLAQHDLDSNQEPHELEVPTTVRTPNRLQRHRRQSWSFSNQMSNMFANIITPTNRNSMLCPSTDRPLYRVAFAHTSQPGQVTGTAYTTPALA